MRERAWRAVAAEEPRPGIRTTRRTWLGLGALSLALGPRFTAEAQTTRKKAPLTADDEKVISAARAAAGKAGLEPFDVKSTEHFLGVGNGPAAYCSAALDHSEDISRDFLAHFRRLGFRVAFPARRLTVVTLKDARSYQAFSGAEAVDETIGGHYDLDANWLVIFDFRPGRGEAAEDAKRKNTFTLVHETIHLLAFNTGLQTLRGDYPEGVSEGLATYGELWTRAKGSSAFGAIEKLRLSDMLRQLDGGAEWIPIASLLADDEVFEKPETVHIAYAEAWLLVHLLLDTPERRPKFQAYLAGTPRIGAQPALDRARYAESKLGSLDELDMAVRRHAQRMGKKAGLRVPAGLTRGRG